ncbi:hypothetical protein [Dyella sp.]|uniref:hypothetical protein n=1 Tax=Dyella sp. TaxID=1869338 RepID=UPI0028422CB0|nr:hypothetical protein [Dyella sp.]MDR3445976.1 hypothetical protein [Dyella sp.]
MAILHLGVVDVSYTDGDGTTTTGDVAGFLEERYHIMRVFLESNEEFISETLVNEVAGAIESIAQGKRVPKLNLAPATGKIEARFREFLDAGELQRLLPKSQKVSEETLRISTRKKSGKTDKPRQAFIDSGLYQASFRAWVT